MPLTVLDLVLKTRTEPAAVPINTCFPDGWKRATVIADLIWRFNSRWREITIDVPHLVELFSSIIQYFIEFHARPMFFPKVSEIYFSCAYEREDYFSVDSALINQAEYPVCRHIRVLWME